MLRFLLALPLVLVPVTARADDAADKAATVKYVLSLQDAETGAFKVTADGKPSLRACNGGVKVLRALGAEVPMLDKLKAFATKCYDAKAGCFTEPDGKPDVAINAVGILVIAELGLKKSDFAGAMTYLKENAKTWEDVRIAAAAVEAWGLKECPFPLDDWDKLAMKTHFASPINPIHQGEVLAFKLRLGLKPFDNTTKFMVVLSTKSKGGWGKPDSETADLETTYRMMRAVYYSKLADRNFNYESGFKTAAFLKSCRNPDGGCGVTPDAPSTLSGTYYAVMIEKWLK